MCILHPKTNESTEKWNSGCGQYPASRPTIKASSGYSVFWHPVSSRIIEWTCLISARIPVTQVKYTFYVSDLGRHISLNPISAGRGGEKILYFSRTNKYFSGTKSIKIKFRLHQQNISRNLLNIYIIFFRQMCTVVIGRLLWTIQPSVRTRVKTEL
jgi:hypothetical protein